MNTVVCKRLVAGVLGASLLTFVAIAAPVGSASAAASKNVLLGKSNKTDKTTTVQNTKGTALSLKSPGNKPSLAVSSKKTVKNLSADSLDGHSSGFFAVRGAVYGTIFAEFPDNAVCPEGTVITGGGGYGDAGLYYSGLGYNVDEENGITLVPNSWFAASNDAVSVTYATCLSLSGKPVPGSLESGDVNAASMAKSLTKVQDQLPATKAKLKARQ